MSFLQSFMFSNFVLALIGVLSLIIAEYLNPIWALVFVGVFLVTRRPGWERIRQGLPVGLVNGFSILVIIYLAIFRIIRQEDLIAGLLDFTIYLQLVKLTLGKQNRDYFQIYLLSFIQLTAATVLTADITFSIPFVLYIIFVPYVLTMYNLKTQIDASKLISSEHKLKAERVLQSKRIVTSKFFIVTSMLSLLTLATTMAIFFTFPRVSFGYLFRDMKHRQNISGFNEQIDLRTFGTIKENSAVVMRVEVDPKYRSKISDIYWRGLAYDRYDGLQWHRSSKERKRIHMNEKTGIVKLRPQSDDSNYEPFHQHIFLAPLDTKVLFGADYPIQLKWSKNFLEKKLRYNIGVEYDQYDSYYFLSNLMNDRNYELISDLRLPNVNQLKQDDPTFHHNTLRYYTQLPDGLAQRVFDLAEEITEGAPTYYDRVQAISSHLMSKYRYTLRVQNGDSASPIEDFLFDRREGHCELFATAMVVLSRAAGIPARLVTGFRGGDWNEYGNYIAVRQKDAHTWVEVPFPSFGGWHRFDPTPPDVSALDYRKNRFALVTKAIDYLELRWYKYIVNFDLKSQISFAQNIYKATVKGAKVFGSSESSAMARWLDLIKKSQEKNKSDGVSGGFTMSLIFMLTFLVAAALFAFRLYRRYRPKRAKQAARIEAQLFAKLQKILEKKGYRRRSGSTPKEYTDEVSQDRDPAFRDLDQLTAIYYRARYGDQPLTDKEIELIKNRVEKLRSVRNDSGTRRFIE